jgi:hypothetical protein
MLRAAQRHAALDRATPSSWAPKRPSNPLNPARAAATLTERGLHASATGADRRFNIPVRALGAGPRAGSGGPACRYRRGKAPSVTAPRRVDVIALSQ